ncbi:MAG: hypothetical protein IPM23_12745 [Candidatus Melainabacteria bacterium]|nr:hypothetical protein [Candidatus Melainabacteria bacterium]
MGGSMLLSPILACLIAFPFFDHSNPLVPIGIGSVAGMSVFLGALALNSRGKMK